MSTDSEDRGSAARWALPTSLALHLLAIVLLIFGLPISPLRPEKEQAVSVDLVPPPKRPEPGAPPPQPAAAQPPKQQPQAQPPKPPKQSETTAKKPPEPPESAPQRKPIPVLNPVHRFGEKDASPKKSEKGESAQNAASASSAQGRPDKQVSAPPKTLTAPGHTGASVPPSSPTPSARPANAESGQGDKELHEAKTLYSGSETGDPIATTAMHNMPRDMRAGWLCVTELRDQLEHSAQPHFPEILPSYRLKEGTLMDISQAAFRVAGQWYDLSFRCQIDPGATKVVYFAFHVGDAIPKEEWPRRGLPSE